MVVVTDVGYGKEEADELRGEFKRLATDFGWEYDEIVGEADDVYIQSINHRYRCVDTPMGDAITVWFSEGRRISAHFKRSVLESTSNPHSPTRYVVSDDIPTRSHKLRGDLDTVEGIVGAVEWYLTERYEPAGGTAHPLHGSNRGDTRGSA